MYERFTDRARKVMALSNQEALRFNHEYIGTEHVLLGLIKEGDGVAAKVLENLDIDLRKIRLEVEKLVQSGPDMVTMGKLPQTPRTKKVIQEAIKVAQERNHNYIGTEHLLIGLLREKEGIAAQILVNFGVVEEALQDIDNLLGVDPSYRLRDERKRLLDEKMKLVANQDFEGASNIRDRMDQIDKELGKARHAAIDQCAKIMFGHYSGKLNTIQTLAMISKAVEDFV